MSAELDNSNHGHSKGDDDYNKLVKYLELLTVDATSDPEDVLSQVITAFNLEVRYTDGEVKGDSFTK